MEKNIKIKKWNKLIEEHYISAINNGIRLKKTYNHSREEMKDWWYKIIRIQGEKEAENIIVNVTHANNNGYTYHPV